MRLDNSNNTHYFVVAYNSKTQTWEWDTEAEEGHFPDGTAVDNDTNEWVAGYIGEGEYLDNQDELCVLLSQSLKALTSTTQELIKDGKL